MTFSAADVGWLLGGTSNLRAWGGVEWRQVNSAYRADLLLSAEGFRIDELKLVYSIPVKRASEPSISIVLREVCIYRLDINGDHREGSKFHRGVDHIQRRSQPAVKMTFEPNPIGVPSVERHKRVSPAQYRALLAAFAAPIRLDIIDLTWSDPPEGRQP